jgi:hypothetical protein
MAEIGVGYGSEWHLLRFLGRHRSFFNAKLCRVTGASDLKWLDYPFHSGKPWKDDEWTGVDFLPEGTPARYAWPDFWPQRGNPPNWDAIGQACIGGAWEWLLVEAKAHVEELTSSCQASENGGLPKIRLALDHTKRALVAPPNADWLNGYYQYANRLAVLQFLIERDIPAHLLFIYFCGDEFPAHSFECPKDKAGWNPALSAQEQHLGLKADHPLASRVHKLFVPVTSGETA